ncbi:hypothetical protein F511_42902 [Dorcoceras hygrometricum]|uniref:Dystroglycan-like n=1 Tax=Dorcoceras hygrometricum TaxID=472368 RepID=A0A2Z7A065_9LAMI|nr:hypothetical protein F511_42902 [Dorcoceras hygrometricum]
MASSFIANALQINFDSVLEIADNAGMVEMFKSMEATGLRGFLGCPTGKFVAITEDRFAGVFGFTDLSEVPKNRVYDARSAFSKSGEQVIISGKKRQMKFEFRLLNDILAKSVTVKAGSFDAVTSERFLLMTAIHFGIKVNWSKVLFGILKEMADRTSKRAKGYAAQICVLLKGDPAITLGEATTFPLKKILTAKTVGTYIATNITINARDEVDEPAVSKIAIVRRKPVSKKKAGPSKDDEDEPIEIITEKAAEKPKSKKRPVATSDAPVVTKIKRTTRGKAALSKKTLEMVAVAQESIPLQIVESISTAQMIYEERIDEEEPAVEKTGEEACETSVFYDVDHIIAQIVSENAQMDTEVSEPESGEFDRTTETIGTNAMVEEQIFEQEMEKDAEPGASDELVGAKKNLSSNKPTDEELMSIDDLLIQISDNMMLQSVTAAEITNIRFGNSNEITDIQDKDLYYASLPQIPVHDKGKEPLVEADAIKGNPAKEMVQLICGDVEFLVQLRQQVIQDVVNFFHSFSISHIADLESLKEIVCAKNKSPNL